MPEEPQAIILLEASVEGHAGGFLARDWHQEPVASLAKESFEMHWELAQEWNGSVVWDYRKMDTFEIQFNFKDGKRSDGACGLKKLSWLSGSKCSESWFRTKHYSKTLFSEWGESKSSLHTVARLGSDTIGTQSSSRIQQI